MIWGTFMQGTSLAAWMLGACGALLIAAAPASAGGRSDSARQNRPVAGAAGGYVGSGPTLRLFALSTGRADHDGRPVLARP